jgi:hypothetical protein
MDGGIHAKLKAQCTAFNHKKKTDTDTTLPDKLNNFFARFENNTVPPSRLANKDCASPPSFSVADMSKTFKRVKPHKAVGPNGFPSCVLRACAGHAQSVYGHIQSLPIPVCCPQMLQDGYHWSCTKEGKDH